MLSSNRSLTIAPALIAALLGFFSAAAFGQNQGGRVRRGITSARHQRPNIVVIMGDDIGMWNIGAYHRGLMAGRTPHIDKLAAEGVIFTDYYAEASCTAGPDGPFGVQGGLGDLTLLDVGIHPVEGFGNLLFGYTAILPTATHAQLGLQEFQLGPTAGVIYKQVPKTLLGVLYQQPFSFESSAQQILVQPIVVRQLPDEWYIRWGELNWIFNTETGDYNIPLNVALGKVVKVGELPINIFVEPFYTPEGLRRGPASQWGVKLNVTFLFPKKKLDPLLGGLFDRSRCCH